MKRRFMFIFVTMMMLSSFCLFNSTSVSAKQQTPKLSSTKISLETGSKKTLKIKKLSKNAKISWKSNNSKIVYFARINPRNSSVPILRLRSAWSTPKHTIAYITKFFVRPRTWQFTTKWLKINEPRLENRLSLLL